MKRLLGLTLVCVASVASTVLAQPFEPDPSHLWKNFNAMPPYVQSVWLDILQNEKDWDFCFYPPHQTENGKYALLAVCKFFEQDRFMLQWTEWKVEVSECGIRCSNAVEVSYGRYAHEFVLWHWKWPGPIESGGQ